MTTRSGAILLTFRRFYTLSGLDEVLPPGTYRVVVDEAEGADVTFLADRRGATRLHLPAVSTVSATLTVFDVEAAEPARAVAADAT